VLARGVQVGPDQQPLPGGIRRAERARASLLDFPGPQGLLGSVVRRRHVASFMTRVVLSALDRPARWNRAGPCVLAEQRLATGRGRAKGRPDRDNRHRAPARDVGLDDRTLHRVQCAATEQLPGRRGWELFGWRSMLTRRVVGPAMRGRPTGSACAGLGALRPGRKSGRASSSARHSQARWCSWSWLFSLVSCRQFAGGPGKPSRN